MSRIATWPNWPDQRLRVGPGGDWNRPEKNDQDFARNRAESEIFLLWADSIPVMIPERLRTHLMRNYGFSDELIQQLWQDLLAFFVDNHEEYIRCRHLELQDQGMKNEQIYHVLRKEVLKMLFPGPKLTDRQIRRIIYG